MRKTIEGLVCLVMGAIIALLLAMCLLTPEKTPGGDYTNPYKYWFDNEYLCKEFRCCIK